MSPFQKLARWLAHKNRHKSYQQIVRQRTILLLPLFILILALLVSDFWQPTFWLSALLLLVLFWGINSTYQASFSYMLLDDVNIAVYQAYLDSSKLIQALNKNSKFIFEMAQVDLDYIQGNFQQADHRLAKLALPKKLSKRTEGFVWNAYKFRLLLDMQLGRQVDLEQSLAQMSQLAIANEELLLGIRAACDLLFVTVANDFYTDKKSDYYLHQLQYDYYSALNAELRGQREKAYQLSQKLATANPQLYLVRQAQEKLKAM